MRALAKAVPVLTTANAVTCNHNPAAPVQFTSATKLHVADSPVLVSTETGPQVLPGCSATSSADKPCTKVVTTTDAGAAKLRAGGDPVVLSALTGTTDGLIKTVAGALKVSKDPAAKLVAR